MAHTDSLDSRVTEEIASQVGRLLPRFIPNTSALSKPAEIAEHFTVWLLPAVALSEHARTLCQMAINTGQWHFQIRIKDSPATIYARAIVLGDNPKTWIVREIFEGPLPAAIDEAIDFIDKNVSDDAVVRVLEIPNFQMTALWLAKDSLDRIVLARAPKATIRLRLLQLYSAQEFLELLKLETPVIGIRHG